MNLTQRIRAIRAVALTIALLLTVWAVLGGAGLVTGIALTVAWVVVLTGCLVWLRDRFGARQR